MLSIETMASGFRSAPLQGRCYPRRPGSHWGPSSLPPDVTRAPLQAPETEEDYLELYQGRIFSSQSRQLFPLQEDLADWLNNTLGLQHLTGENFLDMLDNGVVLCHLARVIQERAQQCVELATAKGPVPTIKGRCWENAARRSFFARDNMENFIQFCRKLGVHQNLLFESDDLVLQGQPRNVVLCLLEMSRIAASYDVEPPGLVQLEKEIAEEESNVHCHSDSGLSHSSLMSWQFQPSPRHSPEKIRHSSSSSALSAGSTNRWGRSRGADRRSLVLGDASGAAVDLRRAASEGNTGGASDGVPSDTTEDDWSRGSGEDPDLEIDQELKGQSDSETTELDRRVQHATRLAQRQCHCSSGKCSKLKMKKVGEGKYHIAGRNVFIRLLKGRHMMVRVGGGWDTLEHFLLRHDPCQVKVVSRDSPSNKSPSPYLHIQAKYRSPPPADRIGR